MSKATTAKTIRKNKQKRAKVKKKMFTFIIRLLLFGICKWVGSPIPRWALEF